MTLRQAQGESPGRLLGLKEVIEETSLSRATIYRKMERGSFPKPRRISRRRVAWAQSDVESWKAQPFTEAPA